jgi:hypothetical protein
MANIPQDLIDKMMVKCARRCCICRRFRPTKLQVHHIVLESDGGSDDEDNLIVTCITCHSDVHSQVPFTRRFTYKELKGHRDVLVKMVSEGIFTNDEPDNFNQRKGIAKNVGSRKKIDNPKLSPEALELLLSAVNVIGDRQGLILIDKKRIGITIYFGNGECPYEVGNRRAEAMYEEALTELFGNHLIKYISETIRQVTRKGYLLADEIASSCDKTDLPSP